MKFKNLKSQLWFNLFIRIAVIFAAFVLILSLANVTLLVNFFVFKEKAALKEQLEIVEQLDFNNESEVLSTLSEINELYNFDVEIYKTSGRILYTTHGGQMMDYFSLKNDKFIMTHEEMQPTKSTEFADGTVFQIAVRRFENREYLLCRKQIGGDLLAEVRIQKQLIANSASIANRFITYVSFGCFVISIVWVLIFAKQFSRPITEINRVTEAITQLKFDEKLKIDRSDEIGRLACSVNALSESLKTALGELTETNARLRDDIEAERRLDAMRRGFVANVSHELKTPIAIISGYAEGLKLNINAASREEYCNTIIDESNRMNKLVLSILELSRYESGQIPLNRSDFDISQLADDMLKRIFTGRSIKAECRIPYGLIINADPLQTEQVLKAYLENAASHTPEHGTVTVTSEQSGGVVRISVINTGSHISEEKMPQIWQSFFRGDSSHKRESSRFGLGLSIVSAIMKLHGRSCGVYNTEDGVCFWFEADAAAPALPS